LVFSSKKRENFAKYFFDLTLLFCYNLIINSTFLSPLGRKKKVKEVIKTYFSVSSFFNSSSLYWRCTS